MKADGVPSKHSSSQAELDLVWRGLSDPTRRRILDMLREEPRTTGYVSAAFPAVTRFSVIKHLKVLEEAGLVRVEPRGRERWNHLNVVPLQEIYDRWLQPYEAVWAGRMWRIKTATERGSEMTEPGLRLVRIEQHIDVDALPAHVFAVMTERVAEWWGPPYVVSEDRVGILLDLRPGGFLWEDWGDGQGIAWATIQGFRRGNRIEFSGTFRMPGAVDGTAVFELEDNSGRTRIRLTQIAIGAIPEGVEQDWSAGWNELIGVRLRGIAERGNN